MSRKIRILANNFPKLLLLLGALGVFETMTLGFIAIIKTGFSGLFSLEVLGFSAASLVLIGACFYMYMIRKKMNFFDSVRNNNVGSSYSNGTGGAVFSFVSLSIWVFFLGYIILSEYDT